MSINKQMLIMSLGALLLAIAGLFVVKSAFSVLMLGIFTGNLAFYLWQQRHGTKPAAPDELKI